MNPHRVAFLPVLALLGTTAVSCSSVVVPTDGSTDGLVAADGADTAPFDATDSDVRDVGPEGLAWMEWFPDGYEAPLNIRSCRTNRYPLQIDFLWVFFSDTTTVDVVQFSSSETPFSAPRSSVLVINSREGQYGRVVGNCVVRPRLTTASIFYTGTVRTVAGSQPEIQKDVSIQPAATAFELMQPVRENEQVRASFLLASSYSGPLPERATIYDLPFPPSSRFRVPMDRARRARLEGSGLSFEWEPACADYVAVHFHGANMTEDLGRCVFPAMEGRGVIPMSVFDALRRYVGDRLEQVTLTFSVVNAAPEFMPIPYFPVSELLLRNTPEFTYVSLR